MDITINMDDELPLFAQLVDGVKAAIDAGRVMPGDALPSIRQLAGDLGLNAKTVAKAYKILERDSVIQTRGYRGTYIHPEAKKNIGVDINAWVTNTLTQTIDSLRKGGATDSEIRIAFNNVMNGRHTTRKE
ncbi:GntR family transcriptional regulator [Kordiimonas sp. SCSIO 12610]|uniref:GntR family transcriptional regulator n=1 Tax=Kordiimonas sp. SCSIO 12610 TaxID=2829597 RepID=UPI00210BC593|nr:GntR family transcriptional regulator [Kordiimonas sp. SCSIO 12610]UTW56065.1 GntR family transcriptional regulator [Kordiimonas sp. SCSIO 12610]